MKKINNAITVLAITIGLCSQSFTVFAQEWSTTNPTYDTGSWSTTYPTYDTGSWSTTNPTYDTGSWSTTYPTYDTGSWSTTYPTYDTGTFSTTYPTYDTGVNYGAVNYGTTNYSTSPSYTYTTPTYTTPTYTTPTYTTPTYTYPTYTNSTYNYSNYTYPTYTYPTYTYPTPVTPVVPVTPVIPVVNTTVCSDGLAPVNGSCVRINTVPVITNTICSDGLPPINGTCVRTNTLPTTINTVCSDGSYPINGSCTRVVTTPTITYQTCWDGTTIPLYSVCPSQYKVCANGTSVPVNQTCYYGNNYVPYQPPEVIKFNNVITSVTTEITRSSARCNGIGLIASGAPSTGWFEYGETGNLGRETAKANIGSSPTAPFSNVLVNLKPATTYYCRAVMQNQYGTVKGEVVAFTTKSTAVSYVRPVTKTTAKTYTKTATKKNEIVCTDGSVATVGSQSAATLINNGQKLVSMEIIKSSGVLAAGSQVNYQLTFKNLSDQALNNLTVKVTIPAEITLTNASAGTFDQTTHTLTVNVPNLAPYGDGAIMWTGVVAKDTNVGKSIATTAYTSYTVPGSNVQDEVTAYVVGSVVPANGTSTSTGAKQVVGSSDRGFLPGSLVEWLALIAIIFIIFILGRSVYTSYTNDRKASH